MKGLIGKKTGMTSVFDGQRYVAVTVVEAGPCVITEIKTPETDGYYATQLAFDEKKVKQTPKAMQGHFKKAGTTPKRKLVEFRLRDSHQQKHPAPQTKRQRPHSKFVEHS